MCRRSLHYLSNGSFSQKERGNRAELRQSSRKGEVIATVLNSQPGSRKSR